jgi:hypothetical protein
MKTYGAGLGSADAIVKAGYSYRVREGSEVGSGLSLVTVKRVVKEARKTRAKMWEKEKNSTRTAAGQGLCQSFCTH